MERNKGNPTWSRSLARPQLLTGFGSRTKGMWSETKLSLHECSKKNLPGKYWSDRYGL